jgi:uncharacterized protein YodC (DUF2158 family)
VFGGVSIFASSSVVRRRMTKIPLVGYPALQYLQSDRVRDFPTFASHSGSTFMIKSGDVVTLESGGQRMTVSSIFRADASLPPMAHCVWFAGGELIEKEIGPEALVLAPDEEPEADVS